MNSKGTQNNQKEASWYDDVYKLNTDYLGHYTQSRYYFIWSVICDRFLRSGLKLILDLGCGPGQFASLLSDKGIYNYCGLDYSKVAIALAQQQSPLHKFIQTDILQSDALKVADYDCVVALEFLEHIEQDIQILQRIKSGTKFYGTVPNFPYISHVRHFNNKQEVRSRYDHLFSGFSVDSLLGNKNGTTYYLIEGIKL
jgi:2-polyprenyl-3-methyl-5-hydroxy-6-metoxy-1,4-benzoquinol methylase